MVLLTFFSISWNKSGSNLIFRHSLKTDLPCSLETWHFDHSVLSLGFQKFLVKQSSLDSSEF